MAVIKFNNNISIRVEWSEMNHGYMWYVDDKQNDATLNEVRGGICKGTFADALDWSKQELADYLKTGETY